MTTDSYYALEDIPPATDLETQILSLETALRQSDPATANTLLDEASGWLGGVWQDAEARGDQSTLVALQESWNRMVAIKNQVDYAAATATAAVTGMKSAARQRDAVAAELEELTEAVLHSDFEHPLVEVLVEHVEEMVTEGMSDYVYDGLEDSFIDDMSTTLSVDWLTARRFYLGLRGFHPGFAEEDIDRLIAALQALKAAG